jgi:hypothetical protein
MSHFQLLLILDHSACFLMCACVCVCVCVCVCMSALMFGSMSQVGLSKGQGWGWLSEEDVPEDVFPGCSQSGKFSHTAFPGTPPAWGGAHEPCLHRQGAYGPVSPGNVFLLHLERGPSKRCLPWIHGRWPGNFLPNHVSEAQFIQLSCFWSRFKAAPVPDRSFPWPGVLIPQTRLTGGAFVCEL